MEETSKVETRSQKRGVLSPSFRGVLACFSVLSGVAQAVPGLCREAERRAETESPVAVGVGNTEPPVQNIFPVRSKDLLGPLKGRRVGQSLLLGGDGDSWSGFGTSVRVAPRRRPGRASVRAPLRRPRLGALVRASLADCPLLTESLSPPQHLTPAPVRGGSKAPPAPLLPGNRSVSEFLL